jgi:hypothetical protein
MKRLLKGLSIALLLVLCTTISVQAVDSWKWYQDIAISDTGGVNQTFVTALTGIKGTNLVSSGYILSSGLDTRVRESDGTSDLPYMVDTANTAIFLTTLNAYQTRTLRYYYGYNPSQTVFPIVVGSGGGITTTDNAGIEPGNSFVLEINAWARSGGISYLVSKGADLTIRIVSGTIKVSVNGVANVITAAGQVDGYHAYSLTLSGGTLTLRDGATVLGAPYAVASINDNASDWLWNIFDAIPCINYIKLSVGGAPKLWYEPNTMVVGTTIPDRQSATYNGAITWGTNTNMDVSVGAIVSYQSNTPAGGVLPNNAGTLTQPTDSMIVSTRQQ